MNGPVWVRERCRISPPVSWPSVVRSNWTRVVWFCCILGCLLFLICIEFVYLYFMPSVLWHCWLGGRKGIWRGYLSVVRCSWCHCHSLSLASVKSRLVLPFWYRLTHVVLDKVKRVCVCVRACVLACVRLCCLSVFSGTVLFVSDWLWRPPPKWPILCRVGH